METLSFFAILGVAAYVLFWYISNLTVNSDGEQGFIGLLRDELDRRLADGQKFKKKTRVASKFDAVAAAFARRKGGSGGKNTSIEANQPQFTEAKRLDDVHAVKRVTLRTVDGAPIETVPLPEERSERGKRRFRQRQRQSKSQSKTDSKSQSKLIDKSNETISSSAFSQSDGKSSYLKKTR